MSELGGRLNRLEWRILAWGEPDSASALPPGMTKNSDGTLRPAVPGEAEYDESAQVHHVRGEIVARWAKGEDVNRASDIQWLPGEKWVWFRLRDIRELLERLRGESPWYLGEPAVPPAEPWRDDDPHIIEHVRVRERYGEDLESVVRLLHIFETIFYPAPPGVDPIAELLRHYSPKMRQQFFDGLLPEERDLWAHLRAQFDEGA